MPSELFQYLLVFGSLVITLAVIAVSIKNVADKLYSIRTTKKRAKRQRFVIFIDSATSSRSDIEATKQSIRKTRYPNLEIVLHTKRTNVTKTFERLNGEYALFLKAGDTLRPQTLSRLNREFTFNNRYNVLILGEDNVAQSSLARFHVLFARSLMSIVRDGVEFVGLRHKLERSNLAVRGEALSGNHVSQRAVTLTAAITPRSHSKVSRIAVLYAAVAVFVIMDYLFAGHKIQLIVALAQVAVTSLLLSLVDARSSDQSRKLLALFAPSALLVILTSTLFTATASLATKISRQTERFSSLRVGRL